MNINDLTTTIQSIKDAKEELRGAINAKGGALADDAKLSEFKDAVEGLPSGGSAFAVDFGEEIASNNTYYIDSIKEEIDYYNEVVRSVESGEKTVQDYISGTLKEEFKNKIAWWPKGWAYPGSFENYRKLKEFISETSTKIINFRACFEIQYIRIKKIAQMGHTCAGNACLKEFSAEDYSSVTVAYYSFQRCLQLKKFVASMPNLTTAQNMFEECTNIEEISIPDSKIVNISMFAYSCNKLKKLELGLNLTSNGTWQSFACSSLEDCWLRNWNAYNIILDRSPNITPYSIHFILNHTESTTARTLTLHATAKANWEASEYYEEDLERAQQLNITIA